MSKKFKNILFITADQWRAECLSVNNHPVVKTPNLDRLAADSVQFLKHYAQTLPCSPSRASIYTGLYQQNHRVTHNGVPLAKRFTNLAWESRKYGYRPMLSGFTDTGHEKSEYHANDPVLASYENVLPGFETIVHTQSKTPEKWIGWLKTKGYDFDAANDPWVVYRPQKNDSDMTGQFISKAPPFYGKDHTESAFLVEKTIEYLSGAGDKWFVHLSFLSPHYPYIAAKPFNDMYSLDTIPRAIRRESLQKELAQHPYLSIAQMSIADSREKLIWDQEQPFPEDPTPREIAQIRATYYGMISEVDYQLGKLFDFLKKNAMYDDTLIVFTSDHGDQLGDHYLFNKNGYFAESYHVPLLIKHPDGIPAKINDIHTEHVDLLPTLVDCLGGTNLNEFDGKSLLPVLNGRKMSDFKNEAHWEYDFADDVFSGINAYNLKKEQCRLSCVRDDSYQYVHFTGMEPLLFDLKKDPHTFVNQAGNSDYAGVTLDYMDKLLKWKTLNDR